MKTVFLPWRGEFGQMLMTYVRWVHGYDTQEKVVCCRPGDEALFPSAMEFYYQWDQVEDHEKNTELLKSEDHTAYMLALTDKLHALYPGAVVVNPLDGCKPQRFGNHPEWNFKPRINKEILSPVDVVLAPRFRYHGEHRNFMHWQAVADALRNHGVRCGCVGMKETSVDIQGITEGMKAWNWDALETHLAMMNAATLVLATDSGLAHLAVLNQNPLRVIYDEPGKEAGHPKWPWVFPHMQAHAVASCEPILYGWNSPETVVSSVLSVLNAGRQA